MRIIGFGHDKQTDQGHLSEGKNIPLFLPQWGQVLEMRDGPQWGQVLESWDKSSVKRV